MFGSVLFDWIDLFIASSIAAATMFLTGCCDRKSLLYEIDWNIIATLGGLLIIGEAAIASGLSDELGNLFVNNMPSQSPYAYIGALFLLSSLASNALSAKAGVLFILPIAVGISELSGMELIPLCPYHNDCRVDRYMHSSSYPTNLMVFGPGSYVYSDYIRLGLPITIIIGVITTIIIPLVFNL